MQSADIKLFDSEIKVMEILWKNGDTEAKEIAKALKEQIGWSKTTTYTVIKKCVDKKAIERMGEGFLCHALVSKEAAQQFETAELINKMYEGAPDKLVAAILGNKCLTAKEIESLKKIVNDCGK